MVLNGSELDAVRFFSVSFFESLICSAILRTSSDSFPIQEAKALPAASGPQTFHGRLRRFQLQEASSRKRVFSIALRL
jgi:hypothetical protein